MTGRKSKEKIRLTDGEKKETPGIESLCVTFPGRKEHMDIPQWLHDKTDHAGTWYDMSMERDML